ncbi:U3 small nucleolar RNA-associated protein [Histoplasma capsulatum G186AR]|uniref:U3 small nucleolar RNA-associated protein n=2 Tax=Ajellomyces capsulatus TaxID=5037 RepID=C0NYX0_AJECG|nr:U3 small nucleolar RNA-associated protein [Histoplasma capsulatum G186AR]EEH03410.1 U3 small nucleolar RNA-associated protein [Histoplasma capsulatum G186AR]KAG5295820.1 U3 small nucleolar RNA-associated protein [Histoplasma capsulatum]QSS73802.1 U3 small nucleolar RNA-associated protein [Histoplasma capsulatum G186AR]
MPSIDSDAFGFPVAKRQKVAPGQLVSQDAAHPPSSRIFSPFRTLGLVSPTTVPFTSVPLGKTTFQITTSVGRSLQTYDLRRGLSLVFLTRPQTPAAITAICAWKDKVLAAWGSGSLANESAQGVWVFKRGKKIGELPFPASPTATAGAIGATEPIEQLLVFGSWIVGCGCRTIRVWKSTTFEHYTTLIPPSQRKTLSSAAASSVTSGGTTRVLTGRICNMPTYLNKIFAGRQDGSIDIWNLSTGKLVYTILPTTPDAGAVTAMQPTPALSLIATAYSSGALTIHNVRTDQVVLNLRSPTSTSSTSSTTPFSPITCISFRTDELGAGHDGRKAGVMATASADSGDITMWDLNNGGKITGVLRDAHESSSSSSSSEEPGVSKIEFLHGQPVLISTGTDNALRSWIFDETPFSPVPRPLHSRSGHSAPITTLRFLPASSDDSDSVGKWILSASKDRSLWGLSLRKDSQSTELSQGHVKLKKKKRGFAGARTEDFKTPEITCMACSLNRDGGMGTAAGAAGANGPVWANVKGGTAEATNLTGWESVVTGHRGDKFARTWFWGRKKAGRWAFGTHDGTEVKSVAVSPCGTFALVGSAGGSIDMYNLQSGMHRQSFPARVTPTQARKLKMMQLDEMSDLATGSSGKRSFQMGEGKHTSAVSGLMVDALNTTVISCGLDGKVKFWQFLTGQLLHELDWHPMCSITGLRANTSSDLIALSCDDLSIRVIDIETRKLVRELWGAMGQINDFCISNDGRWIIAASMDSVIRVWDLPTGHLIDAFRLANTCTALAMSATGEFLATAHADGVGVNIWNNRSLFTHVPTKHIEEDAIVEVSAPTASGEGGAAVLEAAFEEDAGEGGRGEDCPLLPTEQLSGDMMTLSITPKSRWQTLLHLDIIKERNKPKEPPKVPQKAPFFLPSTLSKPDSDSSTQLVSAPAAAAAEGSLGTKKTTPAERSRIAKLQLANDPSMQPSTFTALLHSCSSDSNNGNSSDSSNSNHYAPFIEYLKSLPPAKADLEIRSLDPGLLNGRKQGMNELVAFVEALTAQLRTRRDFELVNAWMAVFLRVHGDVAVEGESVGAGAGFRDGGGDDNEAETTRAALREALARWKVEQEREGRRLAELVGYCRGVVGFLRSAR